MFMLPALKLPTCWYGRVEQTHAAGDQVSARVSILGVRKGAREICLNQPVLVVPGLAGAGGGQLNQPVLSWPELPIPVLSSPELRPELRSAELPNSHAFHCPVPMPMLLLPELKPILPLPKPRPAT